MRILGCGAVVVALAGPAAAESFAPDDAASATVFSIEELRSAMAAAQPGDIIELGPGTYVIDDPLRTVSAGTAEAPIVVRAGGAGGVRLESNVAEAFKVDQPYWRFEHLPIYGTCLDDSTCEHAFHITGEADGTVIADCALVDFNAQIKGNGAPIGPSSTYVYPDDVVIAANQLYDTRPRQTANPVTKLDVVGGRRWQVVHNTIHDFEKAGGDGVSYAAFLKGNSRDGQLLYNRVTCAQAFTGGTRIGLSLGGGGTGPDSICEDGTCTPEHQDGLVAGNLIGHCSDVGIYLNEAQATRIEHNTIIDTLGIDVRYAASTAVVYNNLLSGAIHDRDGGTHTGAANRTDIPDADWQRWFVDPDALDFGLEDGSDLVAAGSAEAQLAWDYCGNDHDDGQPDLGAIEYDDDVEDLLIMCSHGSPPLLCDGAPAGDSEGGGGAGADGGDGGCCGAGGGDPTGALALAGALAVVLGRRGGRRIRRA